MAHYSYDDSALIKGLDELLIGLDYSVLEQTRAKMIEEGSDTEIIDKAIKEKKRRDGIRKREQKIQEKRDKQFAKNVRNASFLGLLGGLFGPSPDKNDMMSWEEDAMKNDGYEPHNFEEEELEEDDYYYEDDK